MDTKASWIKYIFIFIFIFFAMSFFFSLIDGDVLWNYGFSYAISKGEIPYKDFNMIITPIYPMLMAIPLKFISTNIVVYYIVNSFLFVIMFSFLFKMFDYKAWVLLVFLVFPFPSVLLPTYNFFLIFLFVIILYLEKKKKSDYLIGIIIALSFLTKQTVGFCLLLPSIYYLFKDKKKFFKRIISFIVVNFFFLIYLLFTNSFNSFLDLCLFGLFDFTKTNGRTFNIFFFISIVLIIILIKKIFKDKKNIDNYYILSFSSILLPLYDINHFCYFLFVFMFIYMDKINFSKKKIISNSILFVVVYTVLFFMLILNNGSITYPNHYHNFEARLMYNNNGEFIIRDNLNQYIKEHKNSNIVLLSSEAYFYKIINDLEITYFDLINYGNHGYNGTNKMINRIKNNDKNTIYIISMDEYNQKDPYNRQQINKEIMKYVIDHGEFIEEINCFSVYQLK